MLKYFIYLLWIINKLASGQSFEYFTSGCPPNYLCYTSKPPSGMLTLTVKCNGACSPTTSSFSLPSMSQFSNLTQTGSIIIRNDALQQFPNNVCQYGALLIILDASSNSISSQLTSSMLSCLTSLQFLNMSLNSIQTIGPNAFDSTTSLVSLDLSNNQLQFLSSQLFALKLPNLQSLYLQNNMLTSIDVWFFFLKSITYINLSFNRIAAFNNQLNWSPGNNATLKQTANADLIDLSNNMLTSFDDDVLIEYNICKSADLGIFLNLMQPVLLTSNTFDCSCNSYNLLMFYQVLTSASGVYASSQIIKAVCGTPAQFQGLNIFSFEDPNNCFSVSKYPPFVTTSRCINVTAPVVNTPSALQGNQSVQNPSALLGNQQQLQQTANQTVSTSLTNPQIAGVTLAFLGALFLFILLLYCICPIEILACLFDLFPFFHTCCPCKSGVVSNKYYDVFISYNKSSEYWIRNQLVPFFRREKPHDRYYLQHERDNPDNKGHRFGSFTKNKMNNSSTILLVLCDSYLMKEWSNPGFRTHLRTLLTKPPSGKNSRTRFICIQLHDVSDEEVDEHIRDKLQLPQFISLEAGEFFFWKKLEYFLHVNKSNDGGAVSPVDLSESPEPEIRKQSARKEGVFNDTFLLDEYATSLEQIVYEKQPQSLNGDVIQDIKYDFSNKKFSIKLGSTGDKPLQDDSIVEEEKVLHAKRSSKKKRMESDLAEEHLHKQILHESFNENMRLKNTSSRESGRNQSNNQYKHYRSVNRTPRQKQENQESNTKKVLKCNDPNNMTYY